MLGLNLAESPIITALVVLATVTVLMTLVRAYFGNGKGKRAVEGCYFTPKPLLTPNEKEFYTRLKHAVPELEVVCQVSMGAIMNGKHVSGNSFTARARFDRKIIDYVILDGKYDVILLIELDDRTHNKKKDALRDSITAEAGYKTLRFESRDKPSVVELRKAIAAVIKS